MRRFTPILRTVPLYDYECPRCGERFEARVGVSETPPCPACGAPDPHRLLSPFAGPFTIGLRGAAARRSNASRRLREEQRGERRERRARPDG
jgi:putative FmdB family regulatory protein